MDFCDGWFPRARDGFEPEAELARLRAAADEAGRDIKTESTSIFGAPPEAAYLDRCRAAGIDRAILALPSERSDTIMPLLDKYATLLA
jgi:hypothetical protein